MRGRSALRKKKLFWLRSEIEVDLYSGSMAYCESERWKRLVAAYLPRLYVPEKILSDYYLVIYKEFQRRFPDCAHPEGAVHFPDPRHFTPGKHLIYTHMVRGLRNPDTQRGAALLVHALDEANLPAARVKAARKSQAAAECAAPTAAGAP